MLVSRCYSLLCFASFVLGTQIKLGAHEEAVNSCITSDPSQEPGTVKNHTLCVEDTSQRWYILYLPTNYDSISSPSPLIFSYHGGDENATSELILDGFTDPEFNIDAIVAYPQGINDTWQGVPDVSTNDLAFTLKLLDHLIDIYHVDVDRIYASGKSDGGGFVGVLACDTVASKRFAAFAAVSGAFYTTTPASKCHHPDTVEITCSPAEDRLPIPFIEFHGGQDHTICYAGGKRRGVCLPSIPHYVTEWAVRNGFGEVNTTVPITNDTVEYEFGGGVVAGYYDVDIGHDWPSTSPNPDNQRKGHHVATYDATPIILDFFNQHSLS